MMSGNGSKVEMGRVMFELSKPRPTLSPDEWAELAVNRIMMVSDGAPEPIRSQAYGYREQIRQVFATIIRQALETDRAAVNQSILKDM